MNTTSWPCARRPLSLGYDPMILAKIERAGALVHIDRILEVCDGIMVARGDLGVETPIEEIPTVQKRLIEQANRVAKPVITATQMLESMTQYRRPTRAEVTDVANAILDGTDCVMLSGETAIGAHPVETVSVMASIAHATETANAGRFGLGYSLLTETQHDGVDPNSRFGFSVYRLAEGMDVSIVFVPSFSGETARRIARYRLPIWVVAITRDLAHVPAFGLHVRRLFTHHRRNAFTAGPNPLARLRVELDGGQRRAGNDRAVGRGTGHARRHRFTTDRHHRSA